MRPIVNLPKEDRATDVGNMHTKIGTYRACGSGDIPADRQTHRHTDILIAILHHRSAGEIFLGYAQAVGMDLLFTVLLFRQLMISADCRRFSLDHPIA